MYLKYKDINLSYEKQGTGEKELVILPGWGDTKDTFSYLIQLLADYYTIYIVDYPGFGNTAFPNHDLTIYDYTDMIQEWLKSLSLKNPVLLGHSFGGRILITLVGYYGYNYPKIILMNAAGIKPKKTIRSRLRARCYKLLQKIAKIVPKRWRKKYQQALFNHFSSADYRILPSKMQKTFQNIVGEDLKSYLPSIRSKTLLIWGNDDTSTPIEDAIIMKKEIKHATLYNFLNTGHFVYLEQLPKTLELIVDFMDQP